MLWVKYLRFNINLTIASAMLFLSTIQLFFHNLMQSYMVFVLNTVQMQFVQHHPICQIVKSHSNTTQRCLPVNTFVKSNDCYA